MTRAFLLVRRLGVMQNHIARTIPPEVVIIMTIQVVTIEFEDKA